MDRGKEINEGLVRDIFGRARFISDLGVVLLETSSGSCRTGLTVLPKHQQQDGYVHAGVTASIADHTSGGAAASMVPEGSTVLTVEFKINYLRPARGDRLECAARVIKPGRRLIITETEVFSMEDGRAVLTAKAMNTLAVVEKTW